jgi:hypothetical protein
MTSLLHRYRSKYLLNGAAIVALCALLSGCFSFNPRSLRQMESALMESNPDLEFESTMKFGVGPLAMDLVDFAFVYDDDIDISKISRADIGVYEIKQAVAYEDFTMPPGIGRDCPQREVIVRINDEDEHVEIAVCIRKEKITGFAMFVLDAKELVVINAKGDLEALVSSVVRDKVHRKPRHEEERS